MNLEKLNPWNWFKHENEPHADRDQIPVTRSEASSTHLTSNVDPLSRLHYDMVRQFDDMLSSFRMPAIPSGISDSLSVNNALSGNFTGHHRPLIDVSGDDKKYDIVLDVPGLSKSDISIEVNGDVLTIKGQRESKNESSDKKFYRVERSYSSFHRTLSLPEDANSDNTKASLIDGVLKIEIPRQETEAKDVKRISITS